MGSWSPFDKPILDPTSVEFVIPEGWTLDNHGKCRSCGASVAWCVNATSGRKMPVDPDGKSHFSTCPHDDYWRERGKAKREGGP